MSTAAAVVAALAVASCHLDAPPPPVVSCSEMSDHVLALLQPKDGHAHALRDTLEHRCTADHWSERTRTCIAEEPALDAKRGCRDTLTPPQRAMLERALVELDAAPGATVPSQVSADFEACAGAPIPACVEYCRGLMTLAACDKVPQATRDVLRAQWSQAMAAWNALPPDQLAQVCAQGAMSMSQLTSSTLCTP
nr:hypothetical protein [Kofleriaceae bacterium]